MELKEKTINGLFWDFFKTVGKQISGFIVGIILARLLTPRAFGLVGMITVFIAVSNIFINSGFNEALIQKKDCTEKDFATIFYFNGLISLILYVVLFLTSGLIGDFFNEPRLENLIKVLGIVLIINAFTFVQRVRLTKLMDFKLLTKIEVIASFSAGLIAITLALLDFGVWSLVIQSLAVSFISVILFWAWSSWRPTERFDIPAFKELFSFGGKLMMLGVIDTIYSNLYQLIIGKYYSAAQLGHYTRAQAFQRMPTNTVTSIFRRVTYPALSSIQDDLVKLRSVYRRVVKSTMLVTLIMILGLAAVAEDLTVLLIGPDWQLAGEFLQLLCFAGLFLPILALNNNLMKAVGRSDLVLTLGIINKILAVPVILTAVYVGIKPMLMVLIGQQVVVFLLNSYYSGRLINYTTWQQVKDFLPSFLVASFMFFAVYLTGYVINLPLLPKVVLQIVVGAVIAIAVFEILDMDDYRYIKDIVMEKVDRFRRPKELQE